MLGLAGVAISVCGTYLMSVSKRSEGLFAPLAAIWTQQSTRTMLIVALLWSFSAPLDKIAIHHANPALPGGDPYFYTMVTHVLLSLALAPLAFRKTPASVFFGRRNARALVPIGAVSGLAITFQMIAFSLTLVPYAISVKRASALFGILWGKLFFGETNLRERVAGALVILAGAVTILLATL